MNYRPLALAASLCATAFPLCAQDSTSTSGDPFTAFFAHWAARVHEAQESQPNWITPLATTTPRLEEEFRYDQYFETLKTGASLDNYGAGKGLELIPFSPVEIIVAVPAYQVRTGPTAASGFADWPGVLVKYRIASSNNAHGNYCVTVFAQYGLPTGIPAYTSKNHVFTPTLAAGKGWGDFDIQATFGCAMPTHDNSTAGRAYATNVTAQYRFDDVFWPELEMNRTDWSGGARDGRSQTFITPGVVFGRFPIGHFKMIVGVGYQASVAQNYAKGPSTPTYNHNWILSGRTSF
ncbi:MAG TPA: hypothetical protein VGL42_16420 [Opitutaceae bacterium]|jgi:hypothetical protein